MEGTEYDPIFSEEELKILSRYVSDPKSDIFVLLPALYGLGGALFARYSRAPVGLESDYSKNSQMKKES